MMLGEESEPARIWENVGKEALRRGIKRIVMMVILSILEGIRGYTADGDLGRTLGFPR